MSSESSPWAEPPVPKTCSMQGDHDKGLGVVPNAGDNYALSPGSSSGMAAEWSAEESEGSDTPCSSSSPNKGTTPRRSEFADTCAHPPPPLTPPLSPQAGDLDSYIPMEEQHFVSAHGSWLLESLASELCRSSCRGRSRRVSLPKHLYDPILRLPLSTNRRVRVSDILNELGRVLKDVEIKVPLPWVGMLPREVLLHVFEFLSYNDLKIAKQVCRSWLRIAPRVFQNLACLMWPLFAESKMKSKEKELGQALHTDSLYWQKTCYYKFNKVRKWLSQDSSFSCVTIIQQASGLHCVQFDDTELMAGSGPRYEISIWNINEFSSMSGKLEGHRKPVTCLQFDKEHVVSGSLDNTLMLWDRQARTRKRIFQGHTDKVWCVQFAGDRIISGSSDRLVKIWNLTTGECIDSLKEHRTSVSTLRMDGNTIVSGSAGNTIRVWDIGDKGPVCINKMKGHTKGVFCLQMDPFKVLSGSLDNTMRVWDRRAGYKAVQVIQDKEPSAGDPGIICLNMDDTKIISGGSDNIVKVWDQRTWGAVHRLKQHQHWITSLQFDDDKLITSSRDKSVKLWHVN